MWEPKESVLHEIIILLQKSHTPDTDIQRYVNARFEELNTNPDISKYLLYIFLKGYNAEDTVRCLSGIILKNYIIANYSDIPNGTLEHIKQDILKALNDESSVIRTTVSIVISTIVKCGDLSGWPELLPTLVQMLDTDNQWSCEGVMSTLNKVCEDSAVTLCNTPYINRSSIMVPLFVQYFQHPNPSVRATAVGCVNHFISHQSTFIINNTETFLNNLFLLSNETNMETRKNITRTLVLLSEICLERLFDHANQINEYILCRMADDEDFIALEACQFWLSIMEQQPLGRLFIGPCLERLIPHLIKAMQFSDVDVILLKGDVEKDCSTPDNPQDIRPLFHRASKTKNDDEEMLIEWNLRRCSATTLNCITMEFNNDILPLVLPVLKSTLFCDDWKIKESSILALGLIGDTCQTGMTEHLHQLIPYLLKSTSDQKPLVRSISCWALSRYIQSILNQSSNRYMNEFINELLRCMLDDNKRVQEAACSCLANLSEEAKYDMTPYLNYIVNTIGCAYLKYQRRNMLVLYDTIGTLARAVGSALNREEYIVILIPPLFNNWSHLNCQNRDIFPLMECLASLAAALGEGFEPYAPTVYKHCLTIIENNLSQSIANSQQPDYIDAPDKDFIVVSLDLLSSMADGLKSRFETISTNSNLIRLLYASAIDTTPTVRQSAFALLGDLTKSSFTSVQSHISEFVPVLLNNLNLRYTSLCNNAAWALGEITLKLGSFMKLYVHKCLEHLIEILNYQPAADKTLLSNTAITLGRLSFVCPCEVAPHLDRFVRNWCKALRTICDNEDKEIAFVGMCRIVYLNPYGVKYHLAVFCDLIASWTFPRIELRQQFQEILFKFREASGSCEWRKFVQQLPSHVIQGLSKYDIV